MFGRLAKWMRILGFDSAYPDIPDAGLLELSLKEGRLLVTGDTGLHRLALKKGADSLYLEEREIRKQIFLLHAGGYLEGEDEGRVYCSLCNGPLLAVPREEIKIRVPEYVFRTAPGFHVCADCGHVYWAGTHTSGFRELIGGIINNLSGGTAVGP